MNKVRIVKPDAPIHLRMTIISSPTNIEYCQCCDLTDTTEIDIDEMMQKWLDLEFPSYDHFKYHRPKVEFSQYLQEQLKSKVENERR